MRERNGKQKVWKEKIRFYVRKKWPLRVHSFGQPNQPYQPVFPKRIEPVDGRFWFRAFASLFSKRSDVFPQSRGFFLGKQQQRWCISIVFYPKIA